MIKFAAKKEMVRNGFLVILAIALFACGGGGSEDYDSSLPAVPTVPPPTPFAYEIVNVYPHNPTSFTQGLEFFNGKLIESTGEYNRSKIMIVDIKTGIAEKSHTIGDPSIFGEGITVMKDRIFQLTWQNNKIFEYSVNDITKPVRTYTWPYEGWGVTNDGTHLIISDGSGAQLYFVIPDSSASQMKIVKTLPVRNHLGLVNNLNELELINGSLFANRWLTNDILIIDTASGYVTGIMNFRGILSQYDPGARLREGAVLNGIAYDSTKNLLYITGKEWPKLFEIRLTTQ